MSSPRKVLFLVLLVLVNNGGCAPSEEEICRVVVKAAFCGEEYMLPENAALEHIEIRSKKLTTVGKDFAQYENLKILDLSNSGVQDIDQDSFIFNLKLEELNLSGNKDLEIPTNSSFISSKSLTSLNLSNIAIEELPNNSFAELPNLQTLDLSSTDIMEFSSLRNLKNLNMLIISKNSELDKLDLCNETSLQQIIEVENDKRITFNCTKKSNKEPNTNIIHSPSLINSENTTKGEIKETQEKTETTTEISNNKETNTTDNPNTENNKEPENLIDPKNISNTDKLETLKEQNVSVNETSQTDPKPEISQTKNTTETDVLETNEENKDTKEENKKTDDSKPESSPETDKTEAETDMPTDTEKTDTRKIDVESPAVVSNTNTTDTNQNDTDHTDADKHGVQNTEQKTEQNKKPITTHEDIKEKTDESRPAPNEAQTSGTNIVLGIILCVMIVGAMGFGYRYWRNRRSGYRNANTEDVEDGKELQNMVGHHINTEEQT